MRIWLLAVLLLQPACLKQIALRAVADTLSAPGDIYARDDDPELVRDAVPVLLKTMEQLHESLPDHKALALALARGFTQYGYAFVEEEADRVHEVSVDKARTLYARAKRLLLRARRYGLAGLELAAPGVRPALEQDGKFQGSALERVGKLDVPLLYWTAAAWGLAITCDKGDMGRVGELPRVEALMRRALALDESWDEGSIHEFFITYDGGRSEAEGGGPKRARAHFDRAVELSHGRKLAPLVAYAETVDVTTQNRKEFVALLERVARFDVDSAPDYRLVNTLSKRRAEWLQSRADELFVE